MGALRARILKILEPSEENFSFMELFRDAQKAIGNMKRADFGLGDWPMRDLHDVVLIHQLLLGKNAEALKTILTIFYVIEPTKARQVEHYIRINSLYNLLRVVTLAIKDTKAFKGTVVPVLADKVHLHLRFKYIQYIEKYMGTFNISFKTPPADIILRRLAFHRLSNQRATTSETLPIKFPSLVPSSKLYRNGRC